MKFDEDLSQVQSESQQQRLVEDDSTNYDDDWVNVSHDENFENDENCPPNDFQEENEYIKRKISKIDIGQNCRSWLEIMQNFHFKRACTEKIQDSTDYISDNTSDMTLEQQLNAYFQVKTQRKECRRHGQIPGDDSQKLAVDLREILEIREVYRSESNRATARSEHRYERKATTAGKTSQSIHEGSTGAVL